MVEHGDVEAAVRARYASAARSVDSGESLAWGSGDEAAVYGSGCYEHADLDELPGEAVAISIGCANPVAVADLRPGDVVLDLGSGGGIDVLLSARRVGPTGRAYGLDMTDEMLTLARANQSRAGVDNVDFLRGHIEDVPLPDASVDVVISNCVINLSTDKSTVFAEIYRVLRPGGRVAVADVVADVDVEDALQADLRSWADCLGGAITRLAYREGLEQAGFVEIDLQDSHAVAEGFSSAIVRAVKPRARRER
jgi:ubiquinone/menaquinone biosynthesis C-methylase UbiE